MKTKSEKIEIASVDVGEGGHPGSQASKITCVIFRLRPGRYEAVGQAAEGNNQGYFQCNYSHGPWRGRGDTAAQAVAAMRDVVEPDYAADMKHAGQEALIEAEDFEAEEEE